MRVLIRLLLLLRPYWRYIAQSVLAGILLSLLALPGPYITKLLIDEVYPRQDVPLLHFVLLAGAAISLSLALIQALAGHFGQRVGVIISYDFQARLYQHLQGMDFGFFDGRDTGAVLARFDDLQTSLAQVIGLINALVLNLLQLLVFPALLFWMSWRLALISLAVLPFDTALAAFSRRYFGRISRAIAEGGARLSAGAYESLAGIRTIQALGAEACFTGRLRALFMDVAGLQVRASAMENATGFAGTALRAGGSLAYSYYGWMQVLQGDLTMGTFMAFSGYVAYLYGPLQHLIGLIPQVEVTLVHARRFLEFYDRQPAIRDEPGALVLQQTSGAVELRDVWFAYGETPVLRGVNLSIEPGSTVALIGRSGAGKSTLVKLIPRFYDPERGSVLLDGTDVRRYQVASLRRHIGFALQGSCLFHASIRDNLSLGRPVSWRDLEDAARAACIHDVILALPEGYDTMVGEGGSGLSEGQKQRLALARVLLLDTSVLILDEPTAALDTESEAAVRQALETVRQGRTTIIIAHRLSTVQTADRLVVVDDGRVVQHGPPAELSRENGAYARFQAAARQ